MYESRHRLRAFKKEIPQLFLHCIIFTFNFLSAVPIDVASPRITWSKLFSREIFSRRTFLAHDLHCHRDTVWYNTFSANCPFSYRLALRRDWNLHTSIFSLTECLSKSIIKHFSTLHFCFFHQTTPAFHLTCFIENNRNLIAETSLRRAGLYDTDYMLWEHSRTKVQLQHQRNWARMRWA